MELPAEGDDQRTSRKSCDLLALQWLRTSKGGLKPPGRRLERMMLRLKAGLQKLAPAERRKALEQLSSPARQALLRFMTKDLFAAPHGPALRQRAETASSEARVRKHRGVREVPTGLFQASISFWNFLVRSRTSRSFDTALRFFGVLQRFREIAMGSRMLSNAALEAARLAQAQAEACREAGISDGDLKPSYSASVSTQWAGKVESPATSSLQKALAWRQRLEAARGSWQQLREAWMSVLQDERPGGSIAMKRVLAEARVDRAARPLKGREGRADRDKVGIALQKFEKLMSRKAAEGLPCRHGPEQGNLRLLLPER